MEKSETEQMGNLVVDFFDEDDFTCDDEKVLVYQVEIC